jgi:lipooligosaccharide transport system permease protein
VHIRRPLHFAYVNTLWTTPMFLFSGVFFSTNHVPDVMWWISECLPLSHVIGLVRPLLTGQPLEAWRVAVDLGVLLAIFVAGYGYAAWKFQKRLLD